MNHGIIQQGNWTKPGSFLRNKIDSLGLAKNITGGRIYRVVYDGFKEEPKPNMLNDSSEVLLKYLGHPNGWWRDNAQKLIILRGDRSVIPALKEIATGQQKISKNDTEQLARIHALWTLEGLDAVDKEVLLHALNDPDPQVRKTAVWISESFMKKNDSQVIDEVAKLKDDVNYDVRLQVLLSMYNCNSNEAKAVVKQIVEQNANNEIVVAAKDALDENDLVKNLSGRLSNMTAKDKKTILKGATTFRSLCANCHGGDGKGLTAGGTMAAPPLVGAKPFQFAEKDNTIRILLNGLSGPVEGKTYPGEMPSMADNSDRWIASVLSYARYEFGNIHGNNETSSPIVKQDEVKKIREENKDRKKPWTLAELRNKK